MSEVEPDVILAELMAREPIFHRLELGTSRADFEAQTAEDFWEVGASGRVYDRETVWATLRERYADPRMRNATTGCAPGLPAGGSPKTPIC